VLTRERRYAYTESRAAASAVGRVTATVTRVSTKRGTRSATMNRVLYALHRWLSLAVLLQFAAWLCSGLFLRRRWN
jgi:hypothetical protein